MFIHIYSYLLIFTIHFILQLWQGDVGREEGHGRALRHQDPQEGHHHPGRRRGMHHGGEKSSGFGQ